MAFIFTCGTHTFTSLLKDYEHVTARCTNCGNHSAKVFKRWQWFTFCFVPIVPFSLRPWHEVGCHICNFFQDIKYRPDVQQMASQGGNGTGQIPMQPHGGPGGPGYGAPPVSGYHPPPNQTGGKPQYS